MRISLCDPDRRRGHYSNDSFINGKSEPVATPCRVSQMQCQKENCVGPFRSMGFNFVRPNDQYVCVELPLENNANKKLRSLGSAEYQNGKRSQAPKKSRHTAYSYLKPGALAQFRDAQKHGRKRTAEADTVAAPDVLPNGAADGAAQVSGSPERVPAGIAPRSFGPACLQRKKLLAPKFSALPAVQNDANTRVPMAEDATTRNSVDATPVGSVNSNAESVSDPHEPSGLDQSSSLFEALPPEILVRIVCRLNHDELKPAFHVCKSLRQAVMIARQCHFNFTTPGKDHRAVSDQPHQRPDQALPFLSEFAAVGVSTRQPSTPNAPKHAAKAAKPRISIAEMRQIAATLFQSSQIPVAPNNARVPKASSRAGASHRVLFNEEELCQAIAQNSL